MMKNSTGTMLDLSFLTEEEYNKLMNVLQRDAELQKQDSARIQRLQGTLKDEKKRKFVTGQWFLDVKSHRFQEDLQGSDLLRASIRKKKTHKQDNGSKKGSAELQQSSFPISNLHGEQGNRVRVVADESIALKTSPQQNTASGSSFEPIMPCSSKEINTIEDLSPVGIRPCKTSNISDLYETGGHGMVPRALADVLDESEPWSSTPKNSSLRKSPAVPERRNVGEDGSSPSKIPVKRRQSKEVCWSEPVSHKDQSDISTKNTEISRHSSPSSPDAESGKDVKSSSNFTVQSMKDKTGDQETILEKRQFKSLKNFWEKGGDISAGMNSSSDHESTNTKHAQEPTASHTVSVQYSRKQNGEVKQVTEQPYKLKSFSQRAPVLSSSEDEMFHVNPPRKSPSSMIPRSTYNKSKGSPISKNASLSETNGTASPNEESSGRSSKRSKLPVRLPSISKETKVDVLPSPRDDKLPNVSEPEIAGCKEDAITTETKPDVKETPYSNVQILIDAVTSDEEQGTSASVKADRRSKDVVGNATCESEDGKCLEGNVDSNPASVTSARSLVNIYTSTETYNKPQTLSHQLLEPERAKELSRSTPALLSETESDTASEISFQLKRHRKTHSSDSNSSDMASVSSVSNSVLSVYSGDFGSVDAQGAVEFSLDYDEKNREFQINVSQCRDLAIVDEKKVRSDPYVKTYLLPDKARMGKRKTSVKRRTTNPVYNEVLKYKIDKMVLLIQKLNLSVWHNDPLGRNSFLGEMEVDLTCWDWSNTKANWYPLKPRSVSAMNGVDHLGVMNLSIKYIPPGSLGPKHPTSGEVHIWVKDTKDLPQLRPSGVDSFVKCYVLPDTSKKSYQKTRVIKKDSNPVFNHTIVYDGFHTEDLRDACVELTVWDHEKLSNHFLGGIRLGLGTGFSYGIAVDWMDSTQEEVAFWQEMMSTPNEWIEGSLPLRSLAGKRKFK
ncbi:synaptotagmin-like protein 2 isoform X2 [Xenopus laevis]|uniref:Synaptotagmin-like protein 2 n=1 Tax=Xenopus laevis TaxID=8355 RepID=A0A8J1LGI3_XENLA|nr:synaptotagmin-like protein 2 isoform X2 [Xenopus laevis]